VSGFSLLELMFVLGLGATVTGIAVPQLLTSIDDMRTAGAVRYVVSRMQQTRTEAILRSRAAAVRFARTDAGYLMTTYIDGNRNGISERDIDRGVDVALGPAERLRDRFAGVDFGALPGLPAVEAGTAAPGTDPVRLGSSDTATFTPLGTATPGSLYLRGRGSAQYVVRLFGETGRTRILKFDVRSREWKPL
jgi:type II secretory pathway pseudopilin PulG